MEKYKLILSNKSVKVIEVDGVKYQLSASIDVDKFVDGLKPKNKTIEESVVDDEILDTSKDFTKTVYKKEKYKGR